jgi:hypothetical protein
MIQFSVFMKTTLMLYRSCVNFGIIFCFFLLHGCSENKGSDSAQIQNRQPNSSQAGTVNCVVLNPISSYINLSLHVTINDWNKAMALAAKNNNAYSLKMDQDVESSSRYQNFERHGALIGFLDSGIGIYPSFLSPDVSKCYEINGKRIEGLLVSSIEIEPAKLNNSSRDVIKQIDGVLASTKFKSITGKNHQSFKGRTSDEFDRNELIEEMLRRGDFTEEQKRSYRTKEPDKYLPDNRRETKELTNEFLYDFNNNYVVVEIVSKCDFVSRGGLYVPDAPVYYRWKIKFLSKQLFDIQIENYLDNEQRAERDEMKNDSITEQYIRQYGN